MKRLKTQLKNQSRGKKYRLVMAILVTMVLGVCTGPSGWTFEKEDTGLKKICGETGRESGILAWWGSLYPEFCFMGEKAQGKPRMRFWIVENLKKYLETNEKA